MKKVMIGTSILFIPLIILYNSGCNRNQKAYSPIGIKAKETEDRLVLGMMPSLPPTKLFTKYQPLADYLTRKTGKKRSITNNVEKGIFASEEVLNDLKNIVQWRELHIE